MFRLLALVALLVAACGAPAPSPSPTPAPTPTPGPTTPPTPAPTPSPLAALRLLEVTTEGGFIGPAARLGQLPTVVVDTDGKIYMQAFDDSGASHLIPAVDVRDVGADGAAAITQAIHDAALDQNGDDGGAPGDTGVTIFTVELNGEQYVNRVVASGPGRPGGASPAIDLLNRLLDATDSWGASDATSSTYEPVAYRVYVAATDSAGSVTMDWPLATAPDQFGSPATPDFGVTGLRSGIILGDDASAFAAAVAGAASQETFIFSGHSYQVWVRPLLPDELG